MNLSKICAVIKDMKAATLTDHELLKRCQTGDPLAWERFVRTHQQRVFTIAGAYTRTYDDTRDLAQEIFLKIYKNLKKCRDFESLIPWMNALGRNTAIDFLRKTSRHFKHFDDVYESNLTTQDPGPDQIVELKTRKDILLKAMDSLEFIHREILMLKELQELTLDEVSKILGIPIGTAKSRLYHARVQLTRKVTRMTRSEVCSVEL